MKQELIIHDFVKGLKLADTNPLMQKINITQRIAYDLKLNPNTRNHNESQRILQ